MLAFVAEPVFVRPVRTSASLVLPSYAWNRSQTNPVLAMQPTRALPAGHLHCWLRPARLPLVQSKATQQGHTGCIPNILAVQDTGAVIHADHVDVKRFAVHPTLA